MQNDIITQNEIQWGWTFVFYHIWTVQLLNEMYHMNGILKERSATGAGYETSAAAPDSREYDAMAGNRTKDINLYPTYLSPFKTMVL